MCSTKLFIVIIITMCISSAICTIFNRDELQRSNSSEINIDNQKVIDNNTNETKDDFPSRNDIIEESRKKKQQDMMTKILPMMVIPFLVSTSMIPMMLVSLKVLLLKSMVVGKIAILLMLFRLFRRRTEGGGVYSHNIDEKKLPMMHYGYQEGEEYGAYIN